jgi:hypothetical protein
VECNLRRRLQRCSTIPACTQVTLSDLVNSCFPHYHRGRASACQDHGCLCRPVGCSAIAWSCGFVFGEQFGLLFSRALILAVNRWALTRCGLAGFVLLWGELSLARSSHSSHDRSRFHLTCVCFVRCCGILVHSFRAMDLNVISKLLANCMYYWRVTFCGRACGIQDVQVLRHLQQAALPPMK